MSVVLPLPPVTPCMLQILATQPWPQHGDEQQQTDWLIHVFNVVFAHHHTILVRGQHEPEYFPAQHDQPAKIVFAHGYFASALHEISHWCIAGAARRKLPDLGYWYAPDGRNAEQQALFEQVEVKPQALEWLLSAACLREFRVSLDNLNGAGGDGQAFKHAVQARVQAIFAGNAPLPTDAAVLLSVLLVAIRGGNGLQLDDFQWDDFFDQQSGFSADCMADREQNSAQQRDC